jgi:hypothetical protein
MRGQLVRIFIAAVFFTAMTASAVWADSTRVTILYSNDINGQSDPIG